MITRRLAAAALMVTTMLAAPGSAADHDRRLVDAARNQDPVQVRALLGRHVDVNEFGMTPLLRACTNGGAHLQLTLLHKMGVPAERLGDSTGQFTELAEL